MFLTLRLFSKIHLDTTQHGALEGDFKWAREMMEIDAGELFPLRNLLMVVDR